MSLPFASMVPRQLVSHSAYVVGCDLLVIKARETRAWKLILGALCRSISISFLSKGEFLGRKTTREKRQLLQLLRNESCDGGGRTRVTD